jgi:MoaA/NifB/PqqE/SkfB family radical SAM enzyme
VKNSAWRRKVGLARSLWRRSPAFLPERATVILTERCHLRCQFCRLWEDPQSGVSTETWLQFFRANPQLRWVNLSGGELFAKEQLPALLRGLLDALPDLALLDFPTAGQRPEAVVELVQQLMDSDLPQLVVTVSIDGGREVHDELRGVPGAFERAFETFRSLQSIAGRRFQVCIGCTLTERAELQVKSLQEELQRLAPDLSRNLIHFNLAHHSSHYYRNQEFQEWPQEAALRQLEQARLRADPLSWVEWIYGRLARSSLAAGFPAVGCEALRHTIFVAPDLTVFPCSIWERDLGNLQDFDLSLEKLLQSSISHTVRQEIDAGQCPGCFSPCEALPAMLAHPVRATWRALKASRP